ncbi:hypothetical protein CDIOL_02870 [Clostridium diolis]|uniref:Uncharacterized protein n=1 Tax=Clostridium diolis TaxID=223919 RepID=A0AAV3VX99_9CLOT|nr:hypothetical protein CDIOL_02870 [Clostridium diolis]
MEQPHLKNLSSLFSNAYYTNMYPISMFVISQIFKLEPYSQISVELMHIAYCWFIYTKSVILYTENKLNSLKTKRIEFINAFPIYSYLSSNNAVDK